ncbi:MAG: hypothetical protein IT462_05230 [Planctomycetes bacterium]|nr:hypothetical protein [Planctomycetota bacterium]
MHLSLHGSSSHTRIGEAAATAAEAKTQVYQIATTVRMFEDELARHALVIQTLLRICAKKGLFADAEFLKLLEEVDLEDGVRDGKKKKSKSPKTCDKCGKNARATALTCIYCGAEFPTKNPI